MARGSEAKANVVKKMSEIFGADWIGEYDKKFYVWTQENGERIQIAISLTCPKNPIGVAESTDLNFDDFSMPTEIKSSTVPEITEDEKKTVEDLMSRLGL